MTSKKRLCKLCSLHFKFEDFVTDSTDEKGWRKRNRNGNFNKKATKKKCMPSIFKNLPSYYTHNNHLVR